MCGTSNGFLFSPIGIKYNCCFLFERFAREYKIKMSVVRGATLAFSPLNTGGGILKRVFKLALLMSVCATASDFFLKEFQTSVGTPSVRALVYPIIFIGTVHHVLYEVALLFGLLVLRKIRRLWRQAEYGKEG